MSAVADAAEAAVGAPFRLHGRDPACGLDCVGVVALALRAGGFRGDVPSGYALRGGDPDGVAGMLDAVLRRADDAAAGDVLLMATGPGQLHLGVRTAGGFVHADAALRRVIERPGAPPWRVIGAWRIGEGCDGDTDIDRGRIGNRRAGGRRDRGAGGAIDRWRGAAAEAARGAAADRAGGADIVLWQPDPKAVRDDPRGGDGDLGDRPDRDAVEVGRWQGAAERINL